MKCPPGDTSCAGQIPVPPGDGCDQSLAYWFTGPVLHPRLNPNAKPSPGLSVAQLPNACKQVLLAK